MNTSTTPPPSSPPLVWVTQGKEQHPAYLLNDEERISPHAQTLIQWASNQQREWVDSSSISRNLSPRRLRKRLLDTRSDDYSSSPPSKRLSLDTSKHATDYVYQQKEDSEDDEVEFLLTILPPSPKKTASSVTPMPPSSARNRQTIVETPLSSASSKQTPNSDSASSANTSTTDGGVEDLRRALWKTTQTERAENPELHPAGENTASSATPLPETNTCANKQPSPTTATTTEKDSQEEDAASSVSQAEKASSQSEVSQSSSVTFSFQSSAYVQSLAEICHAILWDVRWRVGSQRLLAWERGDDLSAVIALARRFLSGKNPPPTTCSCLLCKDKPRCESSSSKDQNKDRSPRLTEEDGKVVPGENAIDDGDEAYDRSLNLYARIYFRKGPWFRVDDLYKYYAPKQQQTPSTETPPSPEKPSPTKHNSPSKFFRPRSQTKTKSSNSKTLESYIDQEFIDSQMDSVALLLDDLQQLHRMGLIRSFQDEQECGKTVGEVQKYGLLRQDEQRLILAKLGGKQKTTPQANNNGNNKKTGKHNLIWKQMCQQQSISSLAQQDNTTGKNNHVLPVSKHVDHALLQSWATCIVLKASRVDFIPAAFLRSASDQVKSILIELTADRHVKGLSKLCLRLREAPAKALRRCCRLYLCATSGPGDMRGDGTNAWRSLPESHSKDLSNQPLVTSIVPPPGSHSWHQVSYPGQAYRFKLISCSFLRAHQPLLVSDNDAHREQYSSQQMHLQVFPSFHSFQVWEWCVELRANVDYLVELNDLLHYTARRRAREQGEDEIHETSDDLSSDTSKAQAQSESCVDFLDLLTKDGRRKMIESFFSGSQAWKRRSMVATTNPTVAIIHEVERDVALLLGHEDVNGRIQMNAERSRLKNDCEKILGVIAVIAIHVLAFRNRTASDEEVSLISSRPWLRHLWWEGCLAYLLWDIIPILEKRGYYEMAVKALEILLFGKLLTRESNDSMVPKTLVPKDQEGRSCLALVYLSRRARGKAYERLMIDYVHILRHQQKQASAMEGGQGKRKAAGKKAPKSPTPNEITACLCRDLLNACVSNGQITFSATRTLARRLKQPLSETLLGLHPFEAKELGHRFSNSEEQIELTLPDTKARKYSDWTPITDQTVANAMATDESTIGRRCSYVGFEDGGNDSLELGSLNVEELAMEYYRTGRLPDKDISSVKGGWVGWHDEGGKLRALFRVLTSATILGMDWGCLNQEMHGVYDYATIHLTPYQGAPFDLHVGAEMTGTRDANMTARRGFYERRKTRIDDFLDRISRLNPEELSELVYESIEIRLQYAAEIQHTDPALERDIQQVRTLSLLAAGFGGKMLCAIFRCFFFDYRHYLGGLPDLLLVRAVYQDHEDSEALVDLGDWVGEAFSPDDRDAQQAARTASILEDRDDEFLGCNKVGDSGGRTTNRFGRGGRQSSSRLEQPKETKKLELPLRLQLCHSERKVRVECMFVEVKSQNDRLDPRQEDWLNILDKYGNARVCKFGVPKVKKSKGKENGKLGNSKKN